MPSSEPDSLEGWKKAGAGALAPSAVRPHTAAPHMLQEPSPEAPLPFGAYQLIRRIGAGGMGEVFLAREGGPAPRACVVKKVLPNLVANRAFVGRFLDEAKVVVRLKHPNIARVYAMGDVQGEYYLTMEYVQGKTVSRFAKRLRDRKYEMPVGIALIIGEKVCEGLAYAHKALDERGEPLHLVHRDLSPANVCISYKGDIKIIDFGAASSTLKEEQTAPRVVIGNLTYMAPEQAKKQIVDGRADVYSCGVMMWELVSGFVLPQKGDPIERWRKAANPTWDAPSTTRTGVPKDVDAVILKALHKDPSQRYANAAEFQRALREVRIRHAPTLREKDVGDLLSRAFSKEKSAEDAMLHEAVYGKTQSIPTKVVVIPPTALAFEHTAVLAPADFQQGRADQVKTDPEKPNPVPDATPTPAQDPRLMALANAGPVNSQRTGFGVTFAGAHEPVIEASIINEIEASEEAANADYETWTPDEAPLPTWAKAVAFGGIFALAVSLGFLAVWLLMR